MKYRPSVFNIFAGLMLAAAVLTAYFNQDIFMDDQEWGVILLIGLGVLVGLPAVFDLVLQLVIKRTAVLNIVEGIIALVVVLFFGTIIFAL